MNVSKGKDNKIDQNATFISVFLIVCAFCFCAGLKIGSHMTAKSMAKDKVNVSEQRHSNTYMSQPRAIVEIKDMEHVVIYGTTNPLFCLSTFYSTHTSQ